MPKILIIRFSSIGDIVLTTPVIRCVKEQVKDAEVHFLTKKQFSEIVEYNPNIDKRFYLEDNLKKTISELKKEKYDCILDLHNNIRSLFVKMQLGVKHFSFNKLNFEKWLLVNFKINKLPNIHIVNRYFETTKFFGIENDGKGLDYFIPEKDEVDISKVLPHPFHNEYIAFVIGAKHFTKQLPKEKILSICQKINSPVVLLGGKDDFDKGEWILKNIQTQKKIFNACGKFNLNQSAFLIQQSKKVITHDTGLMHIAVVFRKEIISIWGNTIPEFGMTPYYGNKEITNYKLQIANLSCRPCSKIGFSECPKKHFKCMNLIDEDEISRLLN